MIAQKRVPVVGGGAKKEEVTHNTSSSIANQSVQSSSWKSLAKHQNPATTVPVDVPSCAAAVVATCTMSSSASASSSTSSVGGGLARTSHYPSKAMSNGTYSNTPVASHHLHHNNKPTKYTHHSSSEKPFISHYPGSCASVTSTSPGNSFLVMGSVPRTPLTSHNQPHQAMEGSQSKRRNNNNSTWGNKKRYNNPPQNQAYGVPPTTLPAIPSQVQVQQVHQREVPLVASVKTVDSGGGGGVIKGKSGGSEDHQCQQRSTPPIAVNGGGHLKGQSSSETPANPGASARTSSPASNERSQNLHRKSPPVADRIDHQPVQSQSKRQDSSADLKPSTTTTDALGGNSNKNTTSGTPPLAKDLLSSTTNAEGTAVNGDNGHSGINTPNHYPNELLKIIRDNMNGKDNSNLWALLNNISAPLIIKNANGSPTFPLLPSKGSPTNSSNTSSGYSGGGVGCATASDVPEVSLKESAILQAMEQNFIQNTLASALLSNGGLLPSYLADTLLASFAPPPGINIPGNNGQPTVSETFSTKVPPPAVPESPGHGGGAAAGNYHHQQGNGHQNNSSHYSHNSGGHQNHMNYQRVPPGDDGHYGGGSHPQRHHINSLYNQYPHNGNNGGGYSPNSNANFAYNLQPFFYNGHLFYPRPKNYWNFCLSCKKSQFCYHHTNNCNSSASAFHTNGGCGGLPQQQHHYITLPGNYCPPEFYQRPYPHGYYGGPNNYGGGGYYNHHYQGYRDKRGHNGRRQYHNNNKYQGHGNKGQHDASSNGSSTPSGSCPPSPKSASPTVGQQQQQTTSKGGAGGGAQNKAAAGEAKKANDRKGGNATKAESGSGANANVSIGSNKSSLQQSGGSGGGGGRKRWNQRSNAGYESDSSNHRSNGAAGEAGKCNYGLLQNMKLWHTDAMYKREPHLLAGELGPQQVMSPTNHRYTGMPPMLITVLEGQNGGGGDEATDLTTTQPVIQQDEQDPESAYWSSVFPMAGVSLEDACADTVEESTPADKYLENAHLMELLETPKELIEGPGNRDTLSQQVWNSFLIAQQTQETYRKKLNIWKLMYARIKKVFPRLSVFLVGSTITGFGAETSDVDMCVVSSTESDLDPRMEAVINLTDLKKLLSMPPTFEQFHLIQAKVPILRFRDSANHIEVDLNYNNSVGIRNTHLLYCYSQLDWRVRPLVLVVKLWAKYHDINNAKNMTISSYSLALMVIHYLQCGVSPAVLPCLHTMYQGKFLPTGDVRNIDMNEQLDSYQTTNKQTLGDLLLGFLHYYSHFDYNNLAISVRTGSVLYIDDCRYVRSPKNDPQQWKNLCIEEPFDYTNTARSVYDVEVFQKIKYVFVQSYQTLQQTLDLKSVLNEKFISFPVHQYGFGPGQYAASSP